MKFKERKGWQGRLRDTRGELRVKLPQPACFVFFGWGKKEGAWRVWQAVHLFLGAWAVRGGVTGRPELTPPY